MGRVLGTGQPTFCKKKCWRSSRRRLAAPPIHAPPYDSYPRRRQDRWAEARRRRDCRERVRRRPESREPGRAYIAFVASWGRASFPASEITEEMRISDAAEEDDPAWHPPTPISVEREKKRKERGDEDSQAPKLAVAGSPHAVSP